MAHFGCNVAVIDIRVQDVQGVMGGFRPGYPERNVQDRAVDIAIEGVVLFLALAASHFPKLHMVGSVPPLKRLPVSSKAEILSIRT